MILWLCEEFKQVACYEKEISFYDTFIRILTSKNWTNHGAGTDTRKPFWGS